MGEGKRKRWAWKVRILLVLFAILIALPRISFRERLGYTFPPQKILRFSLLLRPSFKVTTFFLPARTLRSFYLISPFSCFQFERNGQLLSSYRKGRWKVACDGRVCFVAWTLNFRKINCRTAQSAIPRDLDYKWVITFSISCEKYCIRVYVVITYPERRVVTAEVACLVVVYQWLYHLRPRNKVWRLAALRPTLLKSSPFLIFFFVYANFSSLSVLFFLFADR